MSDVPTTTIPATQTVGDATRPMADPTAEVISTAQPVTNAESATSAVPAVTETKADEAVAPASTDAAAVAPVEEEKKTDAVAEKVVEPITEGELAYKGPGLLKSLIPSKKEFWLSDDAVAPQHMDMYMRGEKPEVSYPIVAWASHTGKGLLFFNKKGESQRSRPHSVLALYDATDLKKSSPHEITFRLHGHQHTLKAANDAERDGWFASLEKAAEMGKAQKETVRASESYKSEMEKLNKPNVGAGAGHMAAAGAAAGAAGAGVVAAGSRSKSRTKKSTDLDRAEGAARTGSDEEDVKKTQKSRSTSRGMLNRFKGKKEEAEAKNEEAKEERAIEKEAEKTQEKTIEGETSAAVLPGAGAIDAQNTAERVFGAPVTTDEAAAETSATDSAVKAEEKPKINKRNSIFGKMPGWGSMKSPAKEKDIKDAELKPEVPAKDTTVTDAAAAPETDGTTEVVPAVVTGEEATATEATKENVETTTPTAQKAGFLSGLPFMNKRNRSVSPSAPMKEAPAAKEETPIVASSDEVTQAKIDETTNAVSAPVAGEPEKPFVDAPTSPVADAETPVTETAAATTTEEPAVEKAAETTTGQTSKAEKRQSVLGSLGRRASKALNRMQAPKKEAPVAAAGTKEESALSEAAAPATESADKAVASGEAVEAPAVEKAPAAIGDVVPEAVTEGKAPASTPVVAASA